MIKGFRNIDMLQRQGRGSFSGILPGKTVLLIIGGMWCMKGYLWGLDFDGIMMIIDNDKRLT